jgi:putative glutamine amidotransferase
MSRPLIGLTVDVSGLRLQVARAYVRMLADVGADAVLLPPEPDSIEAYLRCCDGFLLTGGDDPIMEHWGVPTHPKARPVDPVRQAFELALLERLGRLPGVPVLGVCLGMQLMALQRGARLDQHLADSLPTADQHCGGVEHLVRGELGRGLVHSHHRQAVIEPGSLNVLALAEDGVIEAIAAPERRFYLGVQWHPEKTADPHLGREIFQRLVQAAAK